MMVNTKVLTFSRRARAPEVDGRRVLADVQSAHHGSRHELRHEALVL